MDNQTLFTKLDKIKNLSEECLMALSKSSTSKPKSISTKEKKDNVTSGYILSIVNKIKNCDESDQIERKILDKTSLPGRILLPFYICHKYFPEQKLTTGDIEKITSGLRVRIQTPNVSKTISKSLHKYLEGNSIPAKGKKPPVYTLNRRGAKYFESLLNPNEKQGTIN